MSKKEVFERNDGKWGWRLIANNGRIVATDGGQGYENKGDAQAMSERIHFDDIDHTGIDWAEERKKPQRIQITMDDGRPLMDEVLEEVKQKDLFEAAVAEDFDPSEYGGSSVYDASLDEDVPNTPEEREQLRQLTEAGIDITEVSQFRSEVKRDDQRRCWVWNFGEHVQITSFDDGKQLIELFVQSLGGGRIRYTYYRQGMEGRWSNMGNGSMVGSDAVARRAVDALGYPIPHELEMWIEGERP